MNMMEKNESLRRREDHSTKLDAQTQFSPVTELIIGNGSFQSPPKG